MTVEENVAVGLGENQDKKIVSEMIERFHLQGQEKRYPRQLSGGQQQRVALARILAYGPDVILLDEPFSAMDTVLKERLRIELIKLLDYYNGLSILVTHDRDEAFQFCDEIIVMDQGKIIAKGPTHDVFENPGKVQVALLTGCKNISKIEVIDDYHLKALEWGVTFEVSEKITSNISHIGIRAHDFTPAEKEDINVLDTTDAAILEMPFEWQVTLSNGLWWKLDKLIYDHELNLPEYIKVDPKNIILLEE